MRRAVVSFADTPAYQDKMKRLKESLKGRNAGADFIGFTNVNQIGAKPHSEIPYAFKPYAIQKAVNMGYDSILWCDSPIIAVKDLEPVFQHIERESYLFFDNIGHPLGRWTNDKALKHFEMSREQAMLTKMIMACCMGFTFQKVSSTTVTQRPLFFNEYHDLANELYPGSWDDHRHDQTVMSFLIDKYGLEILNGQQTFFMYEAHRFAVPINEETICLISK